MILKSEYKNKIILLQTILSPKPSVHIHYALCKYTMKNLNRER
jgi:hypothetical protein